MNVDLRLLVDEFLPDKSCFVRWERGCRVIASQIRGIEAIQWLRKCGFWDAYRQADLRVIRNGKARTCSVITRPKSNGDKIFADGRYGISVKSIEG